MSVRSVSDGSDDHCAGKSMEPPPLPGLLVLGGQSGEVQLNSLETFGFENCSIPPLPETRYSFGTFIAPTQPPQLAVCGGWWMGKPSSTDCLTLNVKSGQWERGTFTNGLLGDGVRGVINIEGQGVFIIHNTGMSFLAPGSDTWTPGPPFPSPAECGCTIKDDRFVTVHMNDSHNVREYFVKNGEAEAEASDAWPSLLTKRRAPGCGATLYHLIVAGGVSNWDEVLATVEIFHIEKKSLRVGGSMTQARAFFNIVPVGSTHPRLLAIGGQTETSTLHSSEWWEEEEDRWQEGPSLSTGRSSFSALMALPHHVCSDLDPITHTCPGAANTQTCSLPTMTSGTSTNINFKRYNGLREALLSQNGWTLYCKFPFLLTLYLIVKRDQRPFETFPKIYLFWGSGTQKQIEAMNIFCTSWTILHPIDFLECPFYFFPIRRFGPCMWDPRWPVCLPNITRQQPHLWRKQMPIAGTSIGSHDDGRIHRCKFNTSDWQNKNKDLKGCMFALYR